MDVRKETGVETYVNDEPDDPNPGIIVDSTENRGRALTSSQARALAADLLSQADYVDDLHPARMKIEIREAGSSRTREVEVEGPAAEMLNEALCETYRTDENYQGSEEEGRTNPSRTFYMADVVQRFQHILGEG